MQAQELHDKLSMILASDNRNAIIAIEETIEALYERCQLAGTKADLTFHETT